MIKSKKLSDNRWFIWTIVFLLVSGVSLVSYIMITDVNENLSMDTTTVSRQVKDSTDSKTPAKTVKTLTGG